MGNKNHRSPTPTGQGLVRGALTTYTSGIVHAAGWLSRLLTLSCVTEAGRKEGTGAESKSSTAHLDQVLLRHLLSWLLQAWLKRKQLAKRK